jgi:hypothetical protein
MPGIFTQVQEFYRVHYLAAGDSVLRRAVPRFSARILRTRFTVFCTAI